MSEQLAFQISGEFITDIARRWFWDENQPYEKSEELLLSALGNPKLSLSDKKAIAQDIIEYKKCLVGTNIVTIEDDPNPVRPLSTKLNELQRENAVRKIEQQMETDPIPFIDPYTSVRSIKALKDGLTYIEPPYTLEKCYEYFSGKSIGSDDTPFSAYHEPFWAGMWLFDEPELVHQVCEQYQCKVGHPTFWKGIYELTKDRHGFQTRNARYTTTIAMERAKQEWLSKPFEEIFPNYNPNKSPENEDNINDITEPDDILRWEGLIDPDGNFYSCTFGGHNVKAYAIIAANIEQSPEKFGDLEGFTYDNSLDYLIKLGWCATRYLPTCGNYITYPDNQKITKAQKDKIWEAIIKHDTHPQIDEQLM